MPGLAVTSDVIVGFPGKTEEEFMKPIICKKHKYAELHVSHILNGLEHLRHG